MDKILVNPLELRAEATISDIDVKGRSFTITYATETPVKRIDWREYKPYDEVLEISDAAIDTTRINGVGISFLDNHSQWSGVRGVYGKVTESRVDGKVAKAKVQMSTRENDSVLEGMWHDIRTGILTSVSVGYSVEKYEKKRAKSDGMRDTYTAKRWTPMEVSVVGIPADPNAVIGRNYDPDKTPSKPENLIEVRCEGDVEAVRSESKPEAVRAESKPETTPPVAASNIENRMEKTPEELLKAERERVSAITTLCRDFKVDPAKTDTFIGEGKTLDDVRAAILEDLKNADPNKGAGGGASPAVGGNRAEVDLAQRMSDGLLLRATNQATEVNEHGEIVKIDAKRIQAANEFRGQSLTRMAEGFLQSIGVETRGMSSSEIAQMVLKPSHTLVRSGGAVTADFPSILGETINKTLRRQYMLADRTYREFCTQTSANDFKPMTRAALGDAPKLALVPEGAEITRGQTKNEKETYAIDAYAKIIALDWRALVNDDLNAFGRLPVMMANEVAQLQSDIIYAILNDNPTMGDGTALFHSTHGNLAGSGGAIDDTTLAAAKQAMRNQKSIGDAVNAGRPLNLTPSFLIVGPAREHQAVKILNYAISPDQTANVNIWQGTMKVIVDARITDNRWFLCANPGVIDTLEYAFLQGREFWVSMERDFDTSGWKWKVETAFGAKALDYRGLYKNAGA